MSLSVIVKVKVDSKSIRVDALLRDIKSNRLTHFYSTLLFIILHIIKRSKKCSIHITTNNKVNEFIREVVQHGAGNNIPPGGDGGDVDPPPNAMHLLLEGVCRLTAN